MSIKASQAGSCEARPKGEARPAPRWADDTMIQCVHFPMGRSQGCPVCDESPLTLPLTCPLPNATLEPGTAPDGLSDESDESAVLVGKVGRALDLIRSGGSLELAALELESSLEVLGADYLDDARFCKLCGRDHNAECEENAC